MRKRLLKRLLLALLLLVALTACALPLLAQQLHYPADAEALAALAPLDYTQGGDLLHTPADPAAATTGLIFYPGALVDHRAYAPLLQHGVYRYQCRHRPDGRLSAGGKVVHRRPLLRRRDGCLLCRGSCG